MEGAQITQAVLSPAAQELQLIRLRPGHMLLRQTALVLLAVLAGSIMLLGKALGSATLRDSGVALGIVGGIALLEVLKRYYPVAGLEVIGTVTAEPNALLLQVSGSVSRYIPLLPGSELVTIWYTGYEGERVGRIELPGYENFISVNNGPRYRFWVPDSNVTSGLRSVLRIWYYRRIRLKEYCQDSRTFLLERNLSYEQIQVYKQEFGVSLFT